MHFLHHKALSIKYKAKKKTYMTKMCLKSL